MAVTLSPLPYAEDALEPHISAETLATHHGKHHGTYVEKVNAAIAGTALDGEDLEGIVKAAREREDTSLFNNAAQAWNHGFYWHSLSPEKTAPSPNLAEAIQRDFGSQDALEAALTEEAVEHFASGWVWLVIRNGKLKVISTHDAGTALTEPVIPLFTVDVWEHAYYLDVKNKRPDYVKAVLDNCLNWDFASENYDRNALWEYPAAAMVERE